jgi:hypothetical protein
MFISAQSVDTLCILIRSSLVRSCWASLPVRCAKGQDQSIFNSWREQIRRVNRQAPIGSTSCFVSANCPSFRMNERINSLANFDPLSARDAMQVLSNKASSFSGRMATPRGDREEAAFVRRNAIALDCAMNGSASSAATK